jgi:hypothetical protein
LITVYCERILLPDVEAKKHEILRLECVLQAWVEKGFETMYRRFAQTPGNTLSMQAHTHLALHETPAYAECAYDVCCL